MRSIHRTARGARHHGHERPPALREARTIVCLMLVVLTGTSCNRNQRETRPGLSLRPGNHEFTIRHGGRNRSYIVHVPPAASAGQPLPVMLAFHGGGGEAAGFQAYAGLDVVADREGFLVVYPFGNGVLPRRLLTWNAGECCGWAMERAVDDVGFTITLLDHLARQTGVDTRRVYATGHSNGAMMAYRLAAERADRIVAIVPVAGAYNLERFAPVRPVALLHIHSVDDPRALYDGGLGPPFPGTNVRSSHRPVMEGIERWRRHNGCAMEPGPVASRTRKAGTMTAGQTAELLRWDGCAPAATVAHWKLTGAGHGWPGNAQAEVRDIIGPATTLVSAAEEAWRFVAPIRR
ncbi:MAG: prolyl oligopeptidase family serine peptidase [Gemmatimonadetes bacterium]|nr:prolyl oligopeptidase family serine peptidase [Gemmatimonadota bacterium]